MTNVKLKETITFNENYWNCECERNYIHPKTQKYCNLCNVDVEGQPDSKTDEVKKYLQMLENIELIVVDK